MSSRPDLDAYFTRIRYAGSRAPTRATLDAIIHAHVMAIPFENLDILLGRGIDIDPAAIEAKLVHGGRGGYCFEQNTLLLHVLAALGFEVEALSARVRIQRPRDFTPPRTHVFVRVMLDGRPRLADVGVGGLSPTASLALDTEDEQETPHEPRRLVKDGAWSGWTQRAPDARIFHQAKLGESWADVCELTLEAMPVIDRVIGNWFTSTHPDSHFGSRLQAARATTDGRVTLLDRELTRRDRHGVGVSHTIASEAELLAVLAEHFGLRFPAGTRFAARALVWS